ncbi:MAG: glycosyltransferase family A protein [Ginsengibacter sp.]
MLPKISIIIPCYNHGKFIKEAVRSVETCTEKDLYEIIILNDGSTDEYTIEQLKKLSTEGYHVINQENKGLGAARNNAIKRARGEYILPLDSDNEIRPEYIYESIKILDKQDHIAVVYSDAISFGESSKRIVAGEFNLQKLMIGNYIDACAVYRRSVWENVGGYDENMPVMGMEDWDFWLNISLQGYEFHYIPEMFFEYRVAPNSMITSLHSDKAIILEAYMQKKYKKYLNRHYINEALIKQGRANKKLAYKFFIALYFPAMLHFLTKNKLIKNPEIF